MFYKYKKILSMGVGASDEPIAIQNKFKIEAKLVVNQFDNCEKLYFSGGRATKNNFLNNAGDCDLIHIASHGFFNSQQPLGSGPLLAYRRKLPSRLDNSNHSQNILMAEQFYQLRLNANLIVFSGCFTGMSDVRPGDECDAGRAGRLAGSDRRGGRLEPRHAGGNRHGCATAAHTRR